MDRRTFAKNSALLALGASVLPVWSCQTNEKKPTFNKSIGVQLWTVRREIALDLEGTLDRLAELGYLELELEGDAYQNDLYYGHPVADFRKMLEARGQSVHSSHCITGAHDPGRRGTILNDWEMALDAARALGQEYIVCAYLYDFERKRLDDYKRLAELFNKAGELAKSKGLQFGFHNHDFEFMQMENQIPYDLLLQQTDPDLVCMELDLYWIHRAGKSALEYFEQHPGRFPLWHVKDMDRSAEQFFAAVGQGSIDWPALFAKAEQAGLHRFYVEQDEVRNGNPFDQLEISRHYLSEMFNTEGI